MAFRKECCPTARRRWLGVILLIGGVVSVPRPARADKVIPLSEAIQTLAAAEKKIHSYSWHFHFSSATLSDGHDPRSIKEKRPGYSDGTFYIDLQTGRYLVEVATVSPWGDGAAPFISVREGLSFDGTTYRHWERERHGKQLPSIEVKQSDIQDKKLGPLTATIDTKEHAHNALWGSAKLAGLPYLPPFASIQIPDSMQFRPLSQLLRFFQTKKEKDQVRIVELDDGRWKLDLPNEPLRRLNPGVKHAKNAGVRYFLDPDRNFAITTVEVYLESEPVFEQTKMRLKQFTDTIWVPEEVTIVAIYSKTIDRMVLTDIQVNKPLTEDDFRTRFPVGTMVDDFINRKSYIVGAGVQNDAHAIRDFMRKYHLDELPDETQPLAASGVSRTRIVLIVVNTIVLLAVLLFLFIRRRRKRSGPDALLILLGLSSWFLATPVAAGGPHAHVVKSSRCGMIEFTETVAAPVAFVDPSQGRMRHHG